jgi:hypothetical protein
VRTVRSECLDWTLIWSQRQLRRVLAEYLCHYNIVRPHRSLELRPPRLGRSLTLVEPGSTRSLVERVDVLGGLIHEYRRAAEVFRAFAAALVLGLLLPRAAFRRADRRTPGHDPPRQVSRHA